MTHHHPDHIGLAGWFAAQGAELLMTRTGWLMARMLTLDVQERPRPETLAFWRAAGMAGRPLRNAQRNGRSTSPMSCAPCRWATPGSPRASTIRIGGRDWTVRCGDGHAPEHATFWAMRDDIVLGGDQLLPSISPNLGVYPTEPEADPVGEWLASCRRLPAATRHRTNSCFPATSCPTPACRCAWPR